MSKDKTSTPNRTVWWLIFSAIMLWIGFGWGQSSQHDQIDTQKQQINTLTTENERVKEQVKSLQTSATSDSITTYTPISATPSQHVCEVTLCADGSCSYSTGRGTCSHHGGEAY